MDGSGILLAGFDTRPVVAAVVVGVALAGPLSGNRLFGTESSQWGPCCLFLCLFPFAENDFCFADDTLPAVGIVAIAEVVVAAVAIVVAAPLVVSAIDLGGPQVALCYNTFPDFAVVRVFEVVVAPALRLLLGLLVPRIPSVLAAHLLRPVVHHFCDLATTLSSLSCAVASVNPSRARWRSSKLFARPCGTPIIIFDLSWRSAATNSVRMLWNVLQSGGLISHSLQSNGYNPDLCRFRYAIPISSMSVIGCGESAFP